MCALTGKICAVISLVLLMKYVSRKKELKKLNKLLEKCHKEFGVLFFVFTIIHTVLSFPKLNENGAFMVMFGIVSLLAGVALMVSGYLIKKSSTAIHWHRWSSVVYIVCVVLHMFR